MCYTSCWSRCDMKCEDECRSIPILNYRTMGSGDCTSRQPGTMNFNASYDLRNLHNFEDEPAFWAHPATPFNGLSEPAQYGMQEFLSRSWSMPTAEVTSPLGTLARLDDPQRAVYGSGQSSEDMGMQLSCSAMKSGFLADSIRAPSDLYPLIPKQSSGFLSYDSYSPTGESSHSTPRRLEELKNWLWLQQEGSIETDMGRCLRIKWLDKSLESLRNLLKRTPAKKWVKDRKKEKLLLQNAHVNAALSVAGLAAAIAAVAAATAASATDEKESRTGVAVASAAALVAAQCADFAEDMGADHCEVASSVSSGARVKSTADILNLTASAASSLQGAVTLTAKPQREARIHAAVSPCERQCSPSTAFSASSAFEESEAECYYSHELLARGCEFLMFSKSSKLHWRFMSVFLDVHKQVIMKLQSRHLAGAFSKTEKRVVLDILTDVPAWPGRSLLHDGEEKCYFGLVTSHGTLEFECKSEFDYQLWTDGISHLLFLAKQHREK